MNLTFIVRVVLRLEHKHRLDHIYAGLSGLVLALAVVPFLVLLLVRLIDCKLESLKLRHRQKCVDDGLCISRFGTCLVEIFTFLAQSNPKPWLDLV